MDDISHEQMLTSMLYLHTANTANTVTTAATDSVEMMTTTVK